jgi:phosphatidylglycerophosphatase C
MDLALFDFDGTITHSDTFTPFLYRSAGRVRLAAGICVLSPLILAYRLGLLPATRMRACAAAVTFAGQRAAEVRRVGSSYSQHIVAELMRTNALERIEWHKRRGDHIVVVSASLDVYLTDICAGLGLDLICTELEAKAGILTGRYQRGDCTGGEKARRVLERYDLTTYGTVHAYGDTSEDSALLGLASRRYFRWEELA